MRRFESTRIRSHAIDGASYLLAHLTAGVEIIAGKKDAKNIQQEGFANGHPLDY
jgi:hypothetical protein